MRGWAAIFFGVVALLLLLRLIGALGGGWLVGLLAIVGAGLIFGMAQSIWKGTD